MKKALLIIGLLLVILLIISIVYLKNNPPLYSDGISFYTDKMKRVVEIKNDGLFNISIENVLVNGNKAKKVELGASRTNHLVAGALLDEDPFITFHNINELEVQPQLSPEEQRILDDIGDRKVIRHYGLRIIGNEVPENITIEYTYLGIPYSLEVDIKE